MWGPERLTTSAVGALAATNICEGKEGVRGKSRGICGRPAELNGAAATSKGDWRQKPRDLQQQDQHEWSIGKSKGRLKATKTDLQQNTRMNGAPATSEGY